MVGGTGLYIKAFCEGMDDVPAVDSQIRQQVITVYEEKGLEFLKEQVVEKDPDFWKTAEQQNPQRLMRALEVILSTGKSINSFRTNNIKNRPFNIVKIGLHLPREQLYEQINDRTNKMMGEGLLTEVENHHSHKSLKALQTVGYKELFYYLENKYSLQEAIEKIKINTRRYAKRQLTWFKKDPNIHWINPDEVSAKDILSQIKS